MIGKKFAHYEVLASLGAGGMGEVYRARDTKLKRDVAIKVLPDDLWYCRVFPADDRNSQPSSPSVCADRRADDRHQTILGTGDARTRADPHVWPEIRRNTIASSKRGI